MDYTIPKIRDKIRLFEKTGQETATLFLTPAEIAEARDLLKGYEYTLTGGYEEAERKMIIVGSTEASASDYMAVIRIESTTKPLAHRSVLGSILGLGVKREVLGDIIVQGNCCDVFVTKEMKSYVLQQLEYVGREKVKVSEGSFEKLLEVDVLKESQVVSIASLRADALISVAYGLSREKSAILFSQEKIVLNFLPCLNSSKAIKEGDLLSVRGFGRIKIVEVVRRNAKGKSSCEIGKILEEGQKMRCGTDICSVERMRESMERLGNQFLHRVFTEKEIAYCEARKLTKYESYAARFAGKEAVYKALSPDKAKGGVFTEVEILNDEVGRPYVVLHGELQEAFAGATIEVSLSHEREFAIAMVIAS